MTPEQYAAEAAQQFDDVILIRGDVDDDALERSIAAAIRAAVAEEREACAREAELIRGGWVTDRGGWVTDPTTAAAVKACIAAAIRARATP